MPSELIPPVGIPVFEVYSGGTAVSSEVKANIVSMEINEEEDQAAMLSITLNLWDSVRQEIKEEYLEQFQLGTPLEAEMGINELSPLFTGEVTALEPHFSREEGDRLTIRAYNRLYRLMFGTEQRTFQKMKDSEIASKIAEEVGLKAEVEDTVIKHSHITQNNIHNFAFLLERRPSNYEVKVEDTTLFFRTTQEPEGPVVTLAYPKDLVRFTPRQRAVNGGSSVQVRGWDVKAKKAILGKAGAGDETSKMDGSKTGAEISAAAFISATRTLTTQTVIDADEAQRIAKAWYNRQQRNFIEADGESPGLPVIRAGKTLELTQLGNAFSGIYYVTSVTHALDSGMYKTRFKIRRNAA